MAMTRATVDLKTITVLGSTGSVGQNTLKVIAAQDGDYEIQALTANQNVELLATQAKAVNAKLAVIADEALLADLEKALEGSDVEARAGREALIEAARRPADWIMAAIMGMAGLEPLMAAIEQGGTVAIANKEPLVAAGPIVMAAAAQYGATLLPIDSEHNAIFQVFERDNVDAIERIVLTASGGPFREMSASDMAQVTPDQALAHPNWDMGAKISIDSATMMNKALEIIEAHYLFNVPTDKIDVLVHPQSVIHSMVEYQDGSFLAQMGASDMCTPITNALGYPKRLKTPGEKLDLTQLKSLDFQGVDKDRFPFVQMAYDCLGKGLQHCIAMNASNEVAVAAFLNHKIAFLDIYNLVKVSVDSVQAQEISSLSDILAYDSFVRENTESAIVDIQSTAKTA